MWARQTLPSYRFIECQRGLSAGTHAPGYRCIHVIVAAVLQIRRSPTTTASECKPSQPRPCAVRACVCVYVEESSILVLSAERRLYTMREPHSCMLSNHTFTHLQRITSGNKKSTGTRKQCPTCLYRWLDKCVCR